ncbi:MAG: Undecaprenyl-diphosphatase [Parcubacteria group bacterium Gr01-1014_46]|nr:MAG: Undecaprenyl-diphosphatase [Parcubacteria group bacterium Gr01-1014_46]
MDLNLIFISFLEGLTEFLPISSTAHLIVTSKILGVNLTLPYIKFYLLVIQLGALLAGLFFFAKKVLTNKKLFINICISFLPSAILGFVLYKSFKKLLEGNMLVLSLALLIGGIIFIYLEKVFMKQNEVTDSATFGKIEMTIMDAFVVGLVQALAIIPGVSRSGATIVAGILRGIKKAVIIEYTFVLALPTLGVAVLYDAYKSREIFETINSYGSLSFGILVAFITSYFTLYLMEKYLTKISLTYFGIYRIVIACLILIVLVF